MKQYHDLVKRILDTGSYKTDRTGTGTLSVFGAQLRFNLQEGFPLLTTKKLHWKSIVAELLWFLRGDSNVIWLNDQGVTIWDEWSSENGDLGPIYGVQWRSWPNYDWAYDSEPDSYDQIRMVIEEIQTNPNSRRLVVSSWNVSDIKHMALPPCHLLFQFYVNDGKLSCHMFQRSADCGLGIPFNIASYALLTHMVAQVCGLDVGELLISITDAHIYTNHVDALKEQLTREERPLPQLILNPNVKDIDDFILEDIKIIEYNPHPAIKMPVAV